MPDSRPMPSTRVSMSYDGRTAPYEVVSKTTVIRERTPTARKPKQPARRGACGATAACVAGRAIDRLAETLAQAAFRHKRGRAQLLLRSGIVICTKRVRRSIKWPRLRSFHHASTAARTTPVVRPRGSLCGVFGSQSWCKSTPLCVRRTQKNAPSSARNVPAAPLCDATTRPPDPYSSGGPLTRSTLAQPLTRSQPPPLSAYRRKSAIWSAVPRCSGSSTDEKNGMAAATKPPPSNCRL